MIYFLSNIYKWTLILLTVESSWAVFAIYFMRSAGLLCPDEKWQKNHENAYDSVGEN